MELKRLKEAESRDGMVGINVYLPADLHRSLKRVRAADRISMSEAVRRAVRSWLAQRARDAS